MDCITGYIVVAIVSCIIFAIFAGKEAEDATICFASILWPIAWLIVLVVLIENIIKYVIKMFVHSK